MVNPDRQIRNVTLCFVTSSIHLLFFPLLRLMSLIWKKKGERKKVNNGVLLIFSITFHEKVILILRNNIFDRKYELFSIISLDEHQRNLSWCLCSDLHLISNTYVDASRAYLYAWYLTSNLRATVLRNLTLSEWIHCFITDDNRIQTQCQWRDKLRQIASKIQKPKHEYDYHLSEMFCRHFHVIRIDDMF